MKGDDEIQKPLQKLQQEALQYATYDSDGMVYIRQETLDKLILCQ